MTSTALTELARGKTIHGRRRHEILCNAFRFVQPPLVVHLELLNGTRFRSCSCTVTGFTPQVQPESSQLQAMRRTERTPFKESRTQCMQYMTAGVPPDGGTWLPALISSSSPSAGSPMAASSPPGNCMDASLVSGSSCRALTSIITSISRDISRITSKQKQMVCRPNGHALIKTSTCQTTFEW